MADSSTPQDLSTPAPPSLTRRLGLLGLGGVCAVGLTWLPFMAEMPLAARTTAAVAFFTAWCWLTGPIPLEAASLLPAFLLPATGTLSASVVAPFYFHDILMLFLGGFILALALERYGLHRRFALRALTLFGARPRYTVLGFMLVAASLSMFISNTSTALLMLPVALAVLEECSPEEAGMMTCPLLLGLAYSASLGGVASPIGTAPNAVLIARIEDRFPEAPEIAFGTWMIGAAPFVFTFVMIAWLVLTRLIGRLPKEELAGFKLVAQRRAEQGPRTAEQKRVFAIFVLVALLWMTRRDADFGWFALPGWSQLLPDFIAEKITDSTVALMGVMLLFVLPGKSPRTGALMDWHDCIRIPWGVLLLLGGGFALARSFDATGLSRIIGEALQGTVGSLSPMVAVLVIALVVTFLTEITSNTATINILLPLLFSTAVAAEIHPLLLGLPATLAVSCAFMLPVATPPNAILFSSGRLTVAQMAKSGVWLNLCTVILVTLFSVYWVAPRWGLNLLEFPDWARISD